MEPTAAPPAVPGYSPFLPLLLLALALLVTLTFQCFVLVSERETLSATAQRQNEPIEQAQRVRAQLQNLLGGIARLANQGNDNAAALLADLKNRGINVRLTDSDSTAAIEETTP